MSLFTCNKSYRVLICLQESLNKMHALPDQTPIFTFLYFLYFFNSYFILPKRKNRSPRSYCSVVSRYSISHMVFWQAMQALAIHHFSENPVLRLPDFALHFKQDNTRHDNRTKTESFRLLVWVKDPEKSSHLRCLYFLMQKQLPMKTDGPIKFGWSYESLEMVLNTLPFTVDKIV